MSDLSTKDIEKMLINQHFFNIVVEESVDSTNDVVKDRANNGEKEGLVIIANEQTKGKVRLGRSFFSPASTGIYMSILLRPDKSAEKSLIITSAAAVAACKAIRSTAGVKASIKWVNDILVDDKKVCGILTEGKIGANNNLEYAVVGIGINIEMPKEGFPEEIVAIATTLKDKVDKDFKNKLIAKILDNLYFYYNDIDLFDDVVRYDYISLCEIMGREITIIDNDNTSEAKAIGIAEDMSLIIKDKDGIRNISSGEISIKIK